jgi:hypothetical protein
MKRLYSLLVIAMLLTSSFVIGLNENFVKAVNTSVSNSQVFILRTCDGRTVYYEGEDICLEIVLNNPYDTSLEFDDLDYELGALNVNNSALATTLLISIFYETNSTIIPPNSYGILFDKIYYPISSRWINGTYNFYFMLYRYPEYHTNLILDIITNNNTNLSNQEDYGYNVMSTTTNKPADQPYGYKIKRTCLLWFIRCLAEGDPRYVPNAKYKFHFYSGTDDLPGDREFEIVREVIREWNNIGGFSFIIEEESKPSPESSSHCKLDYHNHIGWRYPQATWFSPDECFAFNTTLKAVTRLWPELFESKIVDADIAFNDDNKVVEWHENNLRIVARHELGHVISLDDLYNISDLVEDKKQIMHSFGVIIYWGDIAGARWMYPARYDVVSGWFGWETAESDATIGYIDYNSRPDLIVAWIDNPSGPNRIYYKIGWNLDKDGYASS